MKKKQKRIKLIVSSAANWLNSLYIWFYKISLIKFAFFHILWLNFLIRDLFRGEKMVCIQNTCYEIVDERRNGYNEEAFLSRYSDILTKYDYIVGDWGYGQLRLRGFFDDKNQKASFDTKISTVTEYLYEFCNFWLSVFYCEKGKKIRKTVVVITAVFLIV